MDESSAILLRRANWPFAALAIAVCKWPIVILASSSSGHRTLITSLMAHRNWPSIYALAPQFCNKNHQWWPFVKHHRGTLSDFIYKFAGPIWFACEIRILFASFTFGTTLTFNLDRRNRKPCTGDSILHMIGRKMGATSNEKMNGEVDVVWVIFVLLLEPAPNQQKRNICVSTTPRTWSSKRA